MYIVDELKNAFIGLNAWRQNYDTDEYTIADSLVTGESNLYYQDAHPLLTLDNIKSIAPDFQDITYEAWSELTTYRQYERVSYDGNNYRAKTDNINKQPDINTDDWERFDEFSEWLENKTKASIINSLQQFLNEKKVIKTARSIFENKPLFVKGGSFNDLIDNAGNWVGMELVPVRHDGVNIKVQRLGFQSNKAETINIYLFHSSKKDYIHKEEITVTDAYTFQWFDLNWVLPFINDTYDAGGSWYIVYNQNELSGQAINTVRDWSIKPCNCNRGDYNLYNLWSKYVAISPFKITYDSEELWDIENNLYTSETNYGINIELQVYCDYTRTLINQRDLFKDLIYYGVAMDIMREFAYNPNAQINRHQKNTLPSAERILYEIDGDSRGKEGGLIKKFRLAMDAIKLDFEGLSKMCYPCRKTGIKYSST